MFLHQVISIGDRLIREGESALPMGPRDVLNRLEWSESPGLEGVEIWYIHRGVPGDTKIVRGRDVVSIGRHYLELEGVSIPYHRIVKISFMGRVVYERR